MHPFNYPFNDFSYRFLPKNIKILKICDVLAVDSSAEAIYQCFLDFKGYAFAYDERLLIVDHDTDYYPSMDSVGNSMYNILKVLSILDISTDHVVILSSSFGLKRDINYLSGMFNVTPPKTIEFTIWHSFPNLIDYTIPHVDKKYLYVCLNGVGRNHRKTMLGLLKENNLIDCGLISWNNTDHCDEMHPVIRPDLTVESAPEIIHFRTTKPFTRINDELSLCKDSIKLQCRHNFDQPISNTLITGNVNDEKTRWYVDFFHHALIYLVTETVGQYPHVYMSEKTWKAIASKMPFIILGAQHTIRTLQSLGFQTFNTIWDESYDNASTIYERATMIIDVLKSLEGKDINKLQAQLLPIVEHNHHHLKTFEKSQCDKLASL